MEKGGNDALTLQQMRPADRMDQLQGQAHRDRSTAGDLPIYRRRLDSGGRIRRSFRGLPFRSKASGRGPARLQARRELR